MEMFQKIDLFDTLYRFRIIDIDKYRSITLSLTLFISTIIFTHFFNLDFIFLGESKILQFIRTIYHNLTM